MGNRPTTLGGGLDRNNLPIEEQDLRPTTLGGGLRKERISNRVLGSPKVPSQFPDERQTQFVVGQDQEDVVAKQQSGWNLFGKFALNFATEATLGSAEAASYLFDIEQMVEIKGGEEKEFSNWFAELMNAGKESIHAAAPVRQTLESREGFAPSDGTWWASNAESIGSTLAIMFPSMAVGRAAGAVGKGLRYLGKGTRLANKTRQANQAVKIGNKLLYGKKAGAAVEAGVSAGASRYIENTMEAHETYEQAYQELRAKGTPVEEAKKKAGKAASEVWKQNWWLYAIDVAQYMTLTKGIGAASLKAGRYKEGALKFGKQMVGNIASESFEEGFQYVASQESIRAATKDKPFMELKGVTVRMADYLRSPEMHASMFLGGVGGGVFHAFGKAVNYKVKDLADATLANQRSILAGDLSTASKIQDATLWDTMWAHAAAGKLQDLKDHYEDLYNKDDAEFAKEGKSPEEATEIRAKFTEMMEDMDFIEAEFNAMASDSSIDEDTLRVRLSALWDKRTANRSLVGFDRTVKAEAANVSKDGASATQTKRKELNYRLKVVKREIKALSPDKVKNNPGIKEVLGVFNARKAELEKEIADIDKQLDEKGEDRHTITSYDRGFERAVADHEQTLMNISHSDEVLKYTETKEGLEELKKDSIRRRKEMALMAISHDMKLEDVDNFIAHPEYGKDMLSKLEKLAEEGRAYAPAPTDQDAMKKRHESTPLLWKDLKDLKDVGTDTKNITNSEDFLKRYGSDPKFKKAVDELFKDEIAEAEKADTKAQEAPTTPEDVVFPGEGEPENNTTDPEDGDADGRTTGHDNNSMVVQTNEYAMYSLKNGIVTFKGTEGDVKMSLDEARKLEKYQELKEGTGSRFLYTKDGLLIPNENNVIPYADGSAPTPFMTSEEFRLLNDPDVDLRGATVRFQVIANAAWMPGRTATTKTGRKVKVDFSNMLIIAVTDVDIGGTEGTVRLGMLRSTSGTQTDNDQRAMNALRRRIHIEWHNNNKGAATYTTELSTTVKRKTSGQLNMEGVTPQAPHLTLAPNDPLFFGVVTEEDSRVNIILNEGDKTFGVDPTTGMRVRARSGLLGKKGSVVFMRRRPDGVFIPITMYTAAVEEVAAVQEKINALLDTLNTEIESSPDLSTSFGYVRKANVKLRTLTWRSLKLDKESGKFKLGKQGAAKLDESNKIVNAKFEYGDELYSLDEIKVLLQRAIIRVDAKKINTGKYNEKISKAGIVKIQMVAERPFVGGNIELNAPEALPDVEVVYDEETTQDAVKQELTDVPDPEAPPVTSKDDEWFSLDLTADDDIGTLKDDQTRKRVVTGEVTEQWNEEEEKAWLEQNYPDMPLSVLEDLREIYGKTGPEAWGLFQRGIIYVARSAQKGTLYHEAFHAVFNTMLTPKERAHILSMGSEFADGAINIEEYWADKFMDYRFGVITANTLPAKILDFFKRILNLMQIVLERRGVINGPSSVDQYFYRIDKGLYAKFKTPSEYVKRNVTRFRSRLSNADSKLDPREYELGIGTINSHVVLLGIPKVRKELGMPSNASDSDVVIKMLREGRKTGNQKYTMKGLYGRVFLSLYKYAKDSKDLDKDQLSYLTRLLQTFATIDKKDGTFTLTVMFNRAVNRLWLQGIDFNHISESITERETDEHEDDDLDFENWQVKDKFDSAKEKFGNKAKALFAKIRSTREDPAGFPIFEDPAIIYNKLARGLAGSRGVDDMMGKLDSLIAVNLRYNDIYNTLTKNGDLVSEFWKNFGQRENTLFLGVNMKRNGHVSIFDSNRTKGVKNLVKGWAQSVRNSDRYDVSKAEIVYGGDINVDLETIDKLTSKLMTDTSSNENAAVSEEIMDQVYTMLENVGIDILYGEVKEIFIGPKGAYRMQQFLGTASSKGLGDILGAIAVGKDPFFSNANDLGTKKALNNMAGLVLEAIPEIFEPSFLSVKNTSTYGLLQSRFMSRFFRKLVKQPEKDRMAFIERYQKDPFFAESPFLNRLKEASAVENMDLKVMDGFTKQGDANSDKQYSEMTRTELEAFKINVWYNTQPSENEKSKYAHYMMPVFADSPSAAFMKFEKFTNEQAKALLYRSVMQEKARIEWFNERVAPHQAALSEWLTDEDSMKQPVPAGLEDIPLEMLKKGHRYQVFTFMNDKTFKVHGASKLFVLAELEKTARSEYSRMAEEGLFSSAEFTNEETGEVEKITVDNSGTIDTRFMDHFDANIVNYIYNQMYMNLQLFWTFGLDAAYYQSVKPLKSDSEVVKKVKQGTTEFTDTYKRIKQLWSPRDLIAVDDNAYYEKPDGTKVHVPEFYNVSYMYDPSETNDIESEHIGAIKDIFPENGGDNAVVNEFRKLDPTDGATWIDVARLRDIYVGTALWTDAHDEIYEKQIRGEKLPSNAAVTFRPLKPFFYEHMFSKEGRVYPVQNKNAEFMVSPDMAKGNPIIQKALEKMGWTFKSDGGHSFDRKNRMTDVIMFTSAVKLGQIDPVRNLDEITGDNAIQYRNADYGIQQPTPAKHLDAEVRFGVQVRKLMMENIDVNDVDTKYDVDGTEMTGAEIFEIYNTLITKNVEESYDELVKMFRDENGNPDLTKTLNTLRSEVLDRKLGDSMMEALDWADENRTDTVLPLWHPVIVSRVEQIMNSFFKNNVTGQKINGAALYNAPSYGWSGKRKPRIKFDNDPNSPSYRSIKYFEVIMPASARWMQKYADKDGIIKPEYLPESAREAATMGIFARIPTEDYYSMFHVKVIEYLPSWVAGQIIMPDEVTTIAGLDFDIDKVYGMLYNITNQHGEVVSGAEAEFQTFISTEQTTRKGKKVMFKDFEDYDDGLARANFANRRNYVWDEKRDEWRLHSELVKVPSSFDTKKSRDNYLIDIMWAILSHRSTAAKQLSPGNFNTLKAMADFTDTTSSDEVYSLNPMLLSTSREVFDRNMTGLDLVGIHASHNSNHTLTLFTDFEFDTPIVFNGHTGASLNKAERVDSNGKTIRALSGISENLAQSVDNAKFPLAGTLNLNVTNANILDTMIRTLHDPIASMAVFIQPVIKDVFKKYNASQKKGEHILKELLKSSIAETRDAIMDNFGNSAMDDLYDQIKNKRLSDLTFNATKEDLLAYKTDPVNTKITGTLFDQIKLGKTPMKDMTVNDLYMRYKVLTFYSRAMESAKILSDVQAGMRFDSIKRAAGPSVADTKILMEDMVRMENVGKKMIGLEEYLSDPTMLPHVKVFYKYGVKAASDIIGEVAKIPYAGPNSAFDDIITIMRWNSSSKRLQAPEINTLWRMMMTLLATDFTEYAPANMEDRLRNFPDTLQDYQTLQKEGPYSLFINNFRVDAIDETDLTVPFKMIQFDIEGLDDMGREMIKRQWKQMMSSRNRADREIAFGLAEYAFFASGYNFRFNTFSNLIPPSYLSELVTDDGKTLTEHLHDNFNSSYSYNEYSAYIEQILRNVHKKLNTVPYVDISEASNKQFDNNGMMLLTYSEESLKPLMRKPHPFDPKYKNEETGRYQDEPVTYIQANVRRGNNTATVMLKNMNYFFKTPESPASATYVEVTDLGAHNMFYELSKIHADGKMPLESLFISERKQLRNEINERIREENAVPEDVPAMLTKLNEIMTASSAKAGGSKKPKDVFRVIARVDAHRKMVAKILNMESEYDVKEFNAKYKAFVNDNTEDNRTQTDEYDISSIPDQEAEERKERCEGGDNLSDGEYNIDL